MLTEQDLIRNIRFAHQMNAQHELMECLIEWSTGQIHIGNTQEAADILAFLLLQALPHDLKERTEELFDELTQRYCPRVITDAKDFANKAHWRDILEYVGAL
jgi:hypothetical protein